MTRPSTRGGTHAFNHSTQHHTHSKQLKQLEQHSSSCSSSPSSSHDDDNNEYDSNSNNNNSSVFSGGSVSDVGGLKKRVSKGTTNNNNKHNNKNNKIKHNNNSSSKGEKRERRKKHLWSAAEDRLLYELVQQGGARRWDLICRHFEDRNPNQCRERWNNHVNPDVEKGPFSAAEDARLVDLVSQHGTHWATIVDHFPRRSENALKNRYYTLISRGKASIPTTWKFCHHKLSATFFSTFHPSSSNPSGSNSSEETGGDVQASEAVAKGRTASSKTDAAPKRRGRKPKRVRADDDDDDEDYVAAAVVKRGRGGYHSRSGGASGNKLSQQTMSRDDDDHHDSDVHHDEDEPEWRGLSRCHGLEHVTHTTNSSSRDSKQAIAMESPTNTPPRSTRLDRRSSSLYTIASTSIPSDFNCHHHPTTTNAFSNEADAAVRTAKQRADHHHLNRVIECESRGKDARLGHLLHAAYVFDPVHSVVDEVLGEKGGRVVDGLRAFFGEEEKGVQHNVQQQQMMGQQNQQQSARKSLLHVMDPLFLCSPDADEIQHAGQDSTVETSPAGVVHKPGRGVEHGLMSSREAVMAGFLPPVTAFFA